MEGQDCSIPINECVRGTDNCGPHASCIDTQTGFSCQCYWGYQGDGVTCAPSPALADLKSLYFTQPMGQACSEGAPVPWPKYSPGFVYDPMNSLKFFSTDNKTGSPTNVTLEECMIACQMADGCESFVFNDVQQKCFLARGQCPEYNSCGGQVRCLFCCCLEERCGLCDVQCVCRLERAVGVRATAKSCVFHCKENTHMLGYVIKSEQNHHCCLNARPVVSHNARNKHSKSYFITL